MGILNNINEAVGHKLHALRAGEKKLAIHESRLAVQKKLSVHSPDFEPNEPLPERLTADGEGVAPAIVWKEVPAGTQELVLICEDPDAPMPKPFVHWIVYGISPTMSDVPGGMRASSVPDRESRTMQGLNSMQDVGYTPAAPPVRHGTHHYHFQLFALDHRLSFSSTPDRNDMVDAMAGHVLASGEVIATYERR